MDGTRLSVGVPTYNQCDTLRATMLSLMAQDVPPFEIVVSDNHSTDATRDVLDEFRSAVRVVSPPAHMSGMRHWNFLVNQLRGDWFTLVCSDDEPMPGFVRVLRAGTLRSPNAVLVRSGWRTIDGDGRALGDHYLLSVRRLVRPPRTFRENLAGPKTSFAAFAVRKSAWESVGGFAAELAALGDWVLWLRLSPLGDFVYEPAIITRYRVNYRPGLELERVPFELADEAIVASQIIPDVRQQLRGFDDVVIRNAQRARFLARLARLCELVGPSDRDDIASAARAWAGQIGCQQELEQFREGRDFRARPAQLKRCIRPLASLLRWPWF